MSPILSVTDFAGPSRLRLAQQEHPRPPRSARHPWREGEARSSVLDESSGHARENRSGATPGAKSTVSSRSVGQSSAFVAGFGRSGVVGGALYAGRAPNASLAAVRVDASTFAGCFAALLIGAVGTAVANTARRAGNGCGVRPEASGR